MKIEAIIGYILAALPIAAIAVYLILNQRAKVREWLVWAVTRAEKELGGGTGQLKLRQVYDWFVTKFPALSAVLPFRVFSAWVDTALEKMKSMLTNNASVANYVEGGADDELH